ncbi:hypothetical protein JTM42_35830, partial [Pseudomonas aeruginosa]|nr:hypothetical protein [Pseudomonas aeruginosa]
RDGSEAKACTETSTPERTRKVPSRHREKAAVGAGNLAIPLVKQLTAQVKAQDPEAARYVHWGATSQDAIDTGLVLQLRGALDAAETLLEQLLAALALQADRYRD